MKRIIFLLSVLTLVSCRKEYYFEINIPEGQIPNERNIIGKWVSFASARYDTFSEVSYHDTLTFRRDSTYLKTGELSPRYEGTYKVIATTLFIDTYPFVYDVFFDKDTMLLERGVDKYNNKVKYLRLE